MAKRGSKKADAPSALTGQTRIAVLHGPDGVMQRIKLDELRGALETAHDGLDVFRFDGKSAELAEVFDELRGYSLMASYKMVVVDDADDFITKHREPLERYWDHPVDHATLVLRCASWSATTRLHKNLPEGGAIVDCSAPTPAEAVKWLVGRAQSEHKTQLPREAAQRLVDRLGPALGPLDGEVAKLALMVEPGAPITVDLIDQVVGRTSDEKAWEVQEAVLASLARGESGAAIVKAHELVKAAGQPEVLIVYFVADLMRKLALGRAMKSQGAPNGEIGRTLKIWPQSRQQLFFEAMERVSSSTPGRLLDRIIGLDARAKSGLGEPMRNLECFAAGLADEGSRAR